MEQCTQSTEAGAPAPIPMAEPVTLDRQALADLLSQAVASARQGGHGTARAWVYQRKRDLERQGDQAVWYCGWFDLEQSKHSKAFGPGAEGKLSAAQWARKVEDDLNHGSYNPNANKTWQAFRLEYEANALAGLAPRTVAQIRSALAHFERLLNPKKMAAVRTALIDRYKKLRLAEKSTRSESSVSAATVNKELRHLKAALKKAVRWGYLPAMPGVDFLRQPGKLPTYVPPEDFGRLYAACAAARLPRLGGCPPADWWRALLVLLYLTGWRIEQALALRREDLDIESGEVFSAAEANKGRRDIKIVLHALAVEHLRRLPGRTGVFLPWRHRHATLWREFHRIQSAAGVEPERKRWYGFHDLRRAFATLNSDRLTADALQRLMQHKTYTTTQGYIALARQLRPAAENLFVPELPKREAG